MLQILVVPDIFFDMKEQGRRQVGIYTINGAVMGTVNRTEGGPCKAETAVSIIPVLFTSFFPAVIVCFCLSLGHQCSDALCNL